MRLSSPIRFALSRRALSSLVLTLALSAAGGDGAASAARGQEAADEAARFAGRDLAALDVCALVPGDAVATALGGTLERATGSTHSGSGLATDCAYTVRVGRRTVVALVFFYPPQHFVAMRQGEVLLEPVAGVGDEAYWSMAGSMHQLTVLKRGDVTLDARAATQRDARRLAEVALSRL